MRLQIVAPEEIDRADLSAALVEAAELLDEEAFHKAVNGEAGAKESNIWQPNADPLIAFCEETWFNEVNGWLEDIFDSASRHLLKEPFRAEKAISVSYLEMLDELIEKHFKRAGKSAEAAVVRATIAGILGASGEERVDNPNFGNPAEWPETVKEYAKCIRKKDQWHGKEIYSRLQMAAEYAADEITGIGEGTRLKMRNLIYQAELGGWGSNLLERQLYHNFKVLQRDWRRIALTEMAMNAENAYLLRIGPGKYVTCPQVAGACNWCAQNLEKKIFLIVEDPMADDRIKDKYAEHAVWIGKTNVGRYVSGRERGTGRVRGTDELWWPCCPAHPNCRHLFLRIDPTLRMPGPRKPLSAEELQRLPESKKPRWLVGINVTPFEPERR